MLRSEFYKDCIKFIVDQAEKGQLCSEIQLKKIADSLTAWRNPDWSQPTLSTHSRRARILWRYLRNFTFEALEKEAGFSYYDFSKTFGGLERDFSEKAYWSFEDNNQKSLLIIFSAYLSGKESMEPAGERLKWSRQAVQLVIVRVFGKEFPSAVESIRKKPSSKKRESKRKADEHLKILKAGASLGSIEAVEKLMSFGGGKIVFVNRPDLLLFKSPTGKFRLVKGQKLSTGDVVIDLTKITPATSFVVVYEGGSFYKSEGVSDVIVPASAKIDLTQTLRF